MFAILIVIRIIIITFRGGQRKQSGENFGDNGRRKLELNKHHLHGIRRVSTC